MNDQTERPSDDRPAPEPNDLTEERLKSATDAAIWFRVWAETCREKITSNGPGQAADTIVQFAEDLRDIRWTQDAATWLRCKPDCFFAPLFGFAVIGAWELARQVVEELEQRKTGDGENR